ncbi:LOW QUALITY PROTEIN: D-alanine aminotransferase [Geomicrobium sp. JCM 19038]|nr:LOW QUALITY PROTEIN: D-alanine aminotransferase [Geomicrobium sp. JCM 19038]
MSEKVLINEQLINREEASFSFDDRSMYFGDGIYEVIRIYGGFPFQMEMHMQRFQRSAEELDIPFDYDVKQSLTNSLLELLKENELNEGIIYVQLSRGSADRNHLYERHTEPLIFAFTKPMERPQQAMSEGIATYLTEDERWLRCDIKTVNLTSNVMAKRKAADHDCQEALLHRGDLMTEGSSSNLFIIKGDVVQTHPANNYILNGITRQLVLDYIEEHGKSVVFEPIQVEDMKNIDEAFITSTTSEITPIVEFRGTVHHKLTVGPLTKSLQKRFNEDVVKTEQGE